MANLDAETFSENSKTSKKKKKKYKLNLSSNYSECYNNPFTLIEQLESKECSYND